MMHESIILWFAFFVELNKKLYLKGLGLSYLLLKTESCLVPLCFLCDPDSSCFKQCSENPESGDEGGDLPPLSVSDYS